MAELKQIVVPELGSAGDIAVAEVLIAAGDTIHKEQPVATLESDKATLELPSPFAGIVRELKVAPGARVSAGALVALIETATKEVLPASASIPTAAAPAPAEFLEQVAVAVPSPAGHTRSVEPAGTALHASPAARKLARELGIDLRQVTGNQRLGRISTEDVRGQAASSTSTRTERADGKDSMPEHTAPLPAPTVDFTRFGEVQIQPLSRIRKRSAAHLARSWSTIPHVTQHESADITELEAWRARWNEANGKSGLKLTLLAFLIKVSAVALKRFADFNASLDEATGTLALKKYVHIGFATDTAAGLLVPVIRDVDAKGVLDIAREAAELAGKARAGKLGPADLSGGCFSISSLGGIGGTAFTPIVNAPEVAILGVSKSRFQPVWNGTEFEPRLMLPLSLSYDHRVIDGAMAARFIVFVSDALADLRRLLL